MLDAGGGGGGTSWSAMDVPTMWSTVASQDTTAHWEMLTGWRRSFELVLQHMSRVKSYRDNLAIAWPPEKSPASAAYVAQLDALIDYLQDTYDAAIANHTAFSTATLSLSSTRTELKQIYDQYTSNQAKLDAFNAQPKPVQYGKAPLPPARPPVAVSQQEELNTRARVLMSGLSTELVQARMSIATPKAYDPVVLVDDPPPTGGSTGQPSQVIPPIIPTFPADETRTRSAGGTPTLQQPIVDTSAPGRTPGLVLGGVQPGAVPPSSSIPLPSAPAALGGLTPSVISPIPPGGLGGGTPSNGTRNPIGRLPSSVAGVLGANPGFGGRPMAPGGVIGSIPGITPPPPNSTTARPNPIGGVINPANQPQAAGRTGNSYPVGNIAGRPTDRQSQHGDAKKWDPNNPWITAEGVPPVLKPSPEQRVDPGPAIGLP